MRSVLWHLFLLLCSHCFLLLLHLFLRHVFCLLILFGLVLLILLLLSNTAEVWRVYTFLQNISQEAFAEHEIWDPFSKLHPMHPCQQKAMVDTGKNQSNRGWQCCTTSIHLHRDRNISFALESQKRSEEHRKAMSRHGHSSLFNPCPRRKHALGQRPTTNRFTSGCWKNTAWVI